MPPQAYRYRLVDVFTQVAFEGNALAVLPEATGLDTRAMQQIAREFNLSETTFVRPATLPGCVAEVRIFTPTREMRFAGHPTIGTSYVLLDEGRVAPPALEFGLQELIGRVPVRVAREDGDLIWLRTPPIEWGPTYDAALCARALGLHRDDLAAAPPQRLSAGNPTLYIALQSPAVVDRCELGIEGARLLRGTETEPLCVFVFAAVDTGAYSRMFAPEHGVAEDPATGSSTGPLAAYMQKYALLPKTRASRFISEQGVKMRRRSLLHVRIETRPGSCDFDVGGHVTPVGSGTVLV
ncbi:MAG TPA: PhzF family phenazine biosynthesis protein [Steroidobacteraceae bacterium]|jgi:trans-2,3-dihydro-3-hydroxyanthranilate isomerase